MLRSLRRELPLTARGLVRRPAVPLVLVLVVAAGVTFLTTGVTVFDGLLWRALPYGPQARWFMMGEASHGLVVPQSGLDLVAAYEDARARGLLPAVEAFVPLRERAANLGVDGATTRETGTWLPPASFPHLQTPPLLGRWPADPDGAARLAREIAIGEHLWARRFARDPEVVGRRVTVNDEPAVIVGVMPGDFQFHRMSQLWVAWPLAELLADPIGSVPLVVRLAPGATRAQAFDQTQAIREAVIPARTPPGTHVWGSSADGILGAPPVHPHAARLFLAVIALVVAAACLNLATLYLARLRGRAAEHATRQALGAGEGGVLRLLLTEVTLIVLAGGALALVATLWLTGWIHGAMAGVLPFRADLRLGARGFAAALLTLALALALVVVPALRAARRLDLARLLGHTGVIGGAPRHGRGASALIAVQVAVVVVLASAGVPVAASAAKLADAASGRDDHRIAVVELSLLGARYEDPAVRDAYVRRASAALLADPRVERVARVEHFRRWRADTTGWGDSLYVDGEAAPLPYARRHRVHQDVVGHDWFAVAGLRLVAGTGFPDGLTDADERVAVLSAQAARQLFPRGAAVGRRFRRGSTGPWTRVVGVVADERAVYEDWVGTNLEPTRVVYVSERQATGELPALRVRARAITPALLRDLRAAVEGVDPTQAVRRVRPMLAEFRETIVVRRWMAVVLGGGVSVAVLLALTGTFGLVSYYTAARLRELALRVALGAPAHRVTWLVARRTLRSVAIGVGAGSLLLGIMQDGIRRFAYESSVWSPLVLAVIAALVGVVAAAALLVPLRRVHRLAPQRLLRAD